MVLAAFPSIPLLTYPLTRKPQFQSARQQSMSGKRTILPQQTIPRWQWSLKYSGLRSAAYANGAGGFSELETLLGFFNLRSADGMAFTYTDVEDNTATVANFGTTDGATTKFQLYRPYGGFSEPVYAPTISGVFLDGVPFTPGVDYTENLGLLTFTVPPYTARTLTWTGTFAFVCRFDQDDFSIDRVMQGLYEPGAALTFSAEINP